MLKNVTIYRIAEGLPHTAAELAEMLATHPFAPCQPSQAQSRGFVPPREANGAMVEAVGGHWIVKLMTEVKRVPGQVLVRRVDALAAQVEQETGRKPGKKFKKELKEQAVHELTHQAFPQQVATVIWIDPAAQLVMVDAGSASKASGAASALIAGTLGRLSLAPAYTLENPATCMTAWLMDGIPPENFTIDRECSLRGTDTMASVVKYGRHNLDRDDVREHLEQGKLPESLALTWRDRVSFLMTDDMTIKKVQLLDVTRASEPARDAFDADVAITTGELSALIADLTDALGGMQ